MLDLTAPLGKLQELTAPLKCPFSGLWGSLRPSSSHSSGSRSPSSRVLCRAVNFLPMPHTAACLLP